MCAWETHKIGVPSHTTETAQQQNNATPASDVSTKQETQCRAARTPSRGEFKACKYQILRRRRPLFPPQHPHRCPTLENSSGAAKTSSPENSFAVRNVAQIPPPSEQSPITALCCNAWETTAAPRKLDRAACAACDTIRSRRCRGCTFCGSDTPFRDFVDDTFQDRRQPRHQDATLRGPPPLSNLLSGRSQCHQVTPSTTARFRTAPPATLC